MEDRLDNVIPYIKRDGMGMVGTLLIIHVFDHSFPRAKQHVYDINTDDDDNNGENNLASNIVSCFNSH